MDGLTETRRYWKLREEVLDRILWEIRFWICRKTDYVIKEFDRISAETFLAIANKLLSQTS
jgi:hypothetical protein